MGNALLNQTNVTKLEQVLCRNKVEASLVGCTFVPFFGPFGEREMEGF